MDNKNDVLTLLSIEKYQVKMDELEQLFKLVSPLRHFVEKMESNHSICCVGKYINDMVVYYRHEDFHLITVIFHELYTVLIAGINLILL